MKKINLLLAIISLVILQTTAQNTHPNLKNLEWRPIGPANMGGRVTDIVGIPGDPSTYYVAGADGGIFKTTNNGVTMEALFTKEKSYSVGDLTIAPSDHNVLWLGSGEGDPRNSVSYGHGVYRSIDAGETWEHLGLKETERIKRIVVHPDDPDIACVCALGKEWGPNPERGVFKTTDGGKNWKKVLYINEDTGCSDIAIDLSNPRIMYAGMWTFRRKPWRFDDGGKETALYRTKDGGESWEKIMNGLPKTDMARIGVSVAQSSPNIVYLITEFEDGGTLFRSENRGNSWKLVNDDPNLNFRPFYYSDMRVDPTNPQIMYTLSGRLSKSIDGGNSFKTIAQGVHGDHQSFWIDPLNSNRLLSGSDGGYQVSYDQGATWDIVNNVELSQFYQIAIDNLHPYNVYGGLQDNGCWVGPSNSLNVAGILKRHWKRLSYGDGYYAVPIPGSEHEVYTNLQGGVPFHVNANTGVVRSIHPFPKITGSAGDAIENHKYRFNWDAPIEISPHDPNTVYFGGNVIFKSSDRGHSWEVISPDLTTNDKEKQRTSGGTIYQDNTAAEFHCSALYIAESPIEAGVIYVGTDDGNLQVTKDGGNSWNNVNKKLPGLPAYSWIGKIHASEHDAATAFVAIDNHRMNDFSPYAYVTKDYGKSWTKIVNGLPADDYVKVLRQDPHDPNVLFLGMDHGVFVSWDMGNNWTKINNNLPPVSVRDLRIHPRERDLIVGTHGRGVWILDDIRPIEEMSMAKNKNAHVFPVRDATRWHYYQQIENLGQRTYAAKNPEYGTNINVMTSKKGEPVSVAIQDKNGSLVRTLKDTTTIEGVHRIVWDLRSEGALALNNPSKGGWRSGTFRPLVPPGEYSATVTVSGEEFTVPIIVLADPRLSTEESGYQEQYKQLSYLNGLLTEVHKLINESEEINDQLAALKSKMKSSDDAQYKDALNEIASATDKLEAMKNEWQRPPPNMGYRQRPRLKEEIRSLIFAIGNAPSEPTASQMDRVNSLQEETTEEVTKFQDYLTRDLEKINKLAGPMPQVTYRKIKP